MADERTARLDKLEGLTRDARASLSDHAGLLKPRAAALAALAEEFRHPAADRALRCAASLPDVPADRPATAATS